jgi:chemotaxis protein MotA
LDLATILGLVLAFGCVILSAFIGGIDMRILYERYEAFILVFGGTLGASIISFPLRTFLNGIVTGFRTAFFEPEHHERQTIQTLVTFAEKARREGLLALETEAAEVQDDFMRKGIQLVIDGRDTEIIRKILETEVSLMQEKGAKAEAVFMTMGGYSPTLGIIGTVLGLIGMLKGLAAASSGGNVTGSIGNATAQAFVATFFGILLANLAWLPISAKIKERNTQSLLLREIQIEGILSIQAGDNPRLLEEKLHAYLPADAHEPEEQPAAEGAEPAGSQA